MTFDLMWVDFWLKERLFGVGIFTVKKEEMHRSLFSVYWNDGELLVDFLWFRIITTVLFWQRYLDTTTMKIVIAGNYRQYKNYLRENNLTPQQAQYIDTPVKLRGLRNVEVVKYGDWWLNPCANDWYLEYITLQNARCHRRERRRKINV